MARQQSGGSRRPKTVAARVQHTPPFKQGERVGVVLGAGATKACDGPLTAEILPMAFRAAKPGELIGLGRFLQGVFGMPERAARRDDDYPPLPTLLSLLDTAISREHDLGPEWPTARLREVRREAEYAVFRAIEFAMRAPKSWSNRCHENLLEHVNRRTGELPVVVSFNYDLRIDYAMMDVDGGGIPDYACDIRTEGYREAQKFGKLYKIHGSMGWLYCATCHRLDLGVGRSGELRKAGLRVAQMLANPTPSIEASFAKKGLRCPDCSTGFRAVMITPTSLKDYRNPHIASLWYQAERALRECDRVVFVGYSLPWDDVDVIYLLKRGIARAKGQRITVVEWSPAPVAITDHEAGRRYQAVFGRGLDWQPLGFVDWVKTLR